MPHRTTQEEATKAVDRSAGELFDIGAGTAVALLDQVGPLRFAEWLRQAIQKGLDSGPAVPLDAAEIKRLGRARRAAL